MRRCPSRQLNNSYPAFICGFVCISAPSYFLEMYSKPRVKNHEYIYIFFFFKVFLHKFKCMQCGYPLPHHHLQNSTERVGGNTDSLFCL